MSYQQLSSSDGHSQPTATYGSGASSRERSRASSPAPAEEAAPLLCNRWPRSVPFIISSEFSERFCFYGMKSVLVLYFTNHFNASADRATVFFHAFVMFRSVG